MNSRHSNCKRQKAHIPDAYRYNCTVAHSHGRIRERLARLSAPYSSTTVPTIASTPSTRTMLSTRSNAFSNPYLSMNTDRCMYIFIIHVMQSTSTLVQPVTTVQYESTCTVALWTPAVLYRLMTSNSIQHSQTANYPYIYLSRVYWYCSKNFSVL